MAASPSPTSGCGTARCCPRSPSPIARAGTLAPDGRNAVLVTHGYTSGHRMIESGCRFVRRLVEHVGRARCANRYRTAYFVVCSNMLGSSYGSTNAASHRSAHGPAVWFAFPAHHRGRHRDGTDVTCCEHLGVQHLRAVVGPSYGGFQAFQWAVTFPDDMDGIVPVVSSPRAPKPRPRGGTACAVRTRHELARRRLLRHAGHGRDACRRCGWRR